MASHSPFDLEILVHVAAPSRATDDVAYRQLAQAYRSFQPQSRILITSSQPPRDAAQGVQVEADAKAAGSQPPVPLPSSQVFATPAPESLFSLDSQDLSFQSAIDNLSSPGLQTAMARSAQKPTEAPSQRSERQPEESFCEPPSQISDSYPLPDAAILHVSPTRVLQSYLSRSSSLRRLPVSLSASRGQNATAANAGSRFRDIYMSSSFSIPDSQPDHTKQTSHAAPQTVIPVTPVVPRLLVRKRLDDAENHVVLDISHVSSTDPSQQLASSSFRSESEPPPSKRPKISQGEPEALVMVRSSSDTGPMQPSSTPGIEAESANTLEIYAPPPPTGVDDIDPASFVSEKLAKLARDISSRYQPRVARAVRPFERGYWLVDCTTWSPETMLVAWTFLTNYLHKGYAGWGVWCRRGPSHDWLRLYCWGHVAKHTYLLLYLASERHLKLTGAKWHGASGDVVLEVSSNERQA